MKNFNLTTSAEDTEKLTVEDQAKDPVWKYKFYTRTHRKRISGKKDFIAFFSQEVEKVTELSDLKASKGVHRGQSVGTVRMSCASGLIVGKTSKREVEKRKEISFAITFTPEGANCKSQSTDSEKNPDSLSNVDHCPSSDTDDSSVSISKSSSSQRSLSPSNAFGQRRILRSAQSF